MANPKLTPVSWRQLIVVGASGDAERQAALLHAFLSPNARVLLPSGLPVTEPAQVDWRGTSALAMVTCPHLDEHGDWAPPPTFAREIIYAKEDQR